MISNGENREAESKGQQWHYRAVKKLSTLSIGITFKHHCDFYCLYYFYSFKRVNKFQSHKRVC